MNIPDNAGPRADLVSTALDDEILECVFSVIASIKATNPAHDWTPDELYHAFEKRISLPLTVRSAGLAFLMATYLDEAEKQGIQQPTTTTRVALVKSAVGGATRRVFDLLESIEARDPDHHWAPYELAVFFDEITEGKSDYVRLAGFAILRAAALDEKEGILPK